MSNTDKEYFEAIDFAKSLSKHSDNELLHRIDRFESEKEFIDLNSKAGLIIRLSRIFVYSKNECFFPISKLLPSTVSAIREPVFPPADTAVMVMFLRRLSARDQDIKSVLADLGLRTGTIDIMPSKVSIEIRQLFSFFDPGIAQVFSVT